MGLCASNVGLPNCYNSVYIYKCLPRGAAALLPLVPSTIMGTKMKGLYKGFKFISQIFVVKEREMEIGYPTDVKHVAHIGWDGPSGNAAPSWMKEFKTPSDFSATSISNVGAPTWSDQDYEQPKVSKKHKRKKMKSTASSPKSSSSSSSSVSRPYRAATKSKPSFAATVAEAETRSNLLKLVP